jgi:hypothetical protein
MQSSSWVNVLSKLAISREKLPAKVEVAAGIAGLGEDWKSLNASLTLISVGRKEWPISGSRY